MPQPDEIAELLETEFQDTDIKTEQVPGGPDAEHRTVIEEPKKKEELSAEEVAEKQKQEAQQINFSETFEGFADVDEVKRLANRGREFDEDAENEFKTLRESRDKFTALEEKEKQVKSINPYKNEKLFRLDKIMDEKPDEAEFFQKMILGNPSPEEVIKSNLIRKHPDLFKDEPEALMFKLNKAYPAIYSGDYDPTDPEYKNDLLQMKMDSKEIMSGVTKELEGIDIPNLEANAEKQQRDNETFIESWKPHVETIKKEVTKLPITVNDGEKDVHFMDIDIPKNDLKDVQKFAVNHILNQKLKPNTESIEEAKKVALGIYMVQNFSKIMADVLDKSSEDEGKQWRQTISNSKKFGEEKGAGKKKTGDLKDDLFEQISGDLSL